MTNGIRKLFSEVPATYELVNHVLTLGQDRRWRGKAARIAASRGGTRWLDVCTGTGEMALGLRELAGPEVLIAAADFCLPMLQAASGKRVARPIRFVQAEAGALPFPDETFDLVTISFATRNIHVSRDVLLRCFREFYRVLRPGGRFVNLETSQPASKLVRRLFHLYVRLTVKPVGSLISGSKAAYAYLSYTIPRFYSAPELSEILLEGGFGKVTSRPLLLGAVAVHEAVKE